MAMQLPASADALAIEVSETDGRTVVALQGALDAGTAPQLDEKFAEMSRRGSTNVDLDIARLEFMDSSGLSVVVAEHKRAKAGGGGLVIHHPSRRVIRLFQTHGLMSYLVVQPRMST
jgi:anti-sigma B factor antagonist